MNFIIDMNLSPDWVGVLRAHGHGADHWSAHGSPTASDREIMAWAAANERVVFTHDLDFSAILAATQGIAPSVIQLRTQNPIPGQMTEKLLAAVVQFADQIKRGAIVVIDETRSRVRVLPLRK